MKKLLRWLHRSGCAEHRGRQLGLGLVGDLIESSQLCSNLLNIIGLICNHLILIVGLVVSINFSTILLFAKSPLIVVETWKVKSLTNFNYYHRNQSHHNQNHNHHNHN